MQCLKVHLVQEQCKGTMTGVLRVQEVTTTNSPHEKRLTIGKLLSQQLSESIQAPLWVYKHGCSKKLVRGHTRGKETILTAMQIDVQGCSMKTRSV